MARKKYVDTAPSLANKSRNLTSGLMISFGRPLFYTITFSIIGLFYLISLLGYSCRALTKKFIESVDSTRVLLANSADVWSAGFKGRARKLRRKTKYSKTTFTLPYWRDVWVLLLKLDTKRLASLKPRIPEIKIPKVKFEFPKIAKLTFTSYKQVKPAQKAKRPKAQLILDDPVNLAKSFLCFTSLTIVVAASSISSFFFWLYILKDLPNPRDLTTRKIDVSTKIYDRNGIVLYTIFKEKNRTIVPLEEIPLPMRLATLAAEDASFYEHRGVDVRGVTRAIIKNLSQGKLTGGSTITQQLVKNALLIDNEKTFQRKAKEAILAFRVEQAFTKDQILEMYLNEVNYGGTAYGIQEAASAYFGKPVAELTIAEAAFLAGLPKSPSTLSPFSGDYSAGLARQKDIINLMNLNGFISEEEKQSALTTELTFVPNRVDIKAPHFVMYVRSLLAEKYGEENVETGGLEVVTTLDYEIQKKAEEIVKKNVEGLKNYRVGNGAMVVLDPSSGDILAMVGSRDYFDVENDGNVNVAISDQSPGSSIKVINYTYALSTNYTPATIIDDRPVTFKILGQPDYTPRNYDGTYHGKRTLREAFAQSLNIPAVRVEASYGVHNMIEMGRKMGITSWNDESRYGLSLTLGGGEVKLLDLANVYATVANYGKKNSTWPIKKVTNYRGNILESNEPCRPNEEKRPSLVSIVKEANAAQAYTIECDSEQVFDPRVAYQIIDILRDNNARAPAFGRNSQLVIPGHPEVAVKTGTSNDLRDNLTIGITNDFVVAVWVGNNDNSPMSRVASGLTGASTIFNEMMRELLKDKSSYEWQVPAGLVQLPICPYTGTLPCDGCPTKMEWFLEEKKPLLACRSDQILAFTRDSERQRGQILDPAAQTQIFP